MLPRRALLALALALATAFAGCAADDPPRPPATTATPPTEEATSPPPPAPTPEENATEEPTPAPGPEPAEVYNGTHDFTVPTADPTKPDREPFSVVDGYAQVAMTVRYTSKTGDLPVTLSNSLAIRLVAPDGASSSCGLSLPECERSLDAQAGEWAIEYTGQGNYEVHVTVVAS